MANWTSIVETGGGAGLWIGLLLIAFLTALHLDAAASQESERAPLRARRLGLLALFLAAVAGVALAWGPPESETRRWREAAVWWVPSIVVLWMGAWSARAGAAGATSRLAAAQAVPAILLQLAPPLGWSVGGALLAGVARLGVPPLHLLHLAAAETLSLGTLVLLLVLSLALGAPPALASVEAIGGEPLWIGAVLALAVGAIGVASLRDFSLTRRLAVWTGTQAGLALLITWVLAAEEQPAATVGLRHAAACAAVLPLLGYSFGGVLRAFRTDDLRATGGLFQEARWRAVTLMAAALAATLFSAGAAGLLVAVGLSEGLLWLPRMAVVAALVGWLGANLSLALAAYRIVRGRRPAPGVEIQDLRVLEWVLLVLLTAFVLWVFGNAGFGEPPTAWPAPGGVL